MNIYRVSGIIFFIVFMLSHFVFCQPKADSPKRFSLSIYHLGLFSKVNYGDQLFHPFLSRPFIIGYEDINRPVFYSGWRSSIAFKLNPKWEVTLNMGVSTFGVQSRMYYYENRQVSSGFGGEKVKFLNSFIDGSISGRFYMWNKSSTSFSFLKTLYSGVTLHWLFSDRARAENHILNRNNSVVGMGGNYLRWHVLSAENMFQALKASIDLKNHRLGGSLFIGMDIPLLRFLSLIHEIGFTFTGSLLYPNSPGALIKKNGTITALYLMNGIKIYIF